MKTFIDVSQYQKGLNIGKLIKDKGYSGAMIRSGSGVGIDDKEMSVFAKQTSNYGFYHYGYIGSYNTPEAEAKYFIDRVRPFYYEGIPLALDVEEPGMSFHSITTFCDMVAKAFPKAYVMIYTNGNWYNQYGLDKSDYAIWFAKPNDTRSNDTGIANVCAKQYHFGERGGALGAIDLNADYKDIFNILRPKKEYYEYAVDREKLNDEEGLNIILEITTDKVGEYEDEYLKGAKLGNLTKGKRYAVRYLGRRGNYKVFYRFDNDGRKRYCRSKTYID